jgi:GNAT superfamily N-acetyltransferase
VAPTEDEGARGQTAAIRDASSEDLDVLGALFRRSSLVYEDGREALLAHPEVLVFSFPLHGDWACRVALDEGERIIGFATALFAGGRVELEDLFVDPDRMRQGVGRRLIADVEDLARRRGVNRIEVDANPRALGFYEKTGFVVDHVVQTQFGEGLRMHLSVG